MAGRPGHCRSDGAARAAGEVPQGVGVGEFPVLEWALCLASALGHAASGLKAYRQLASHIEVITYIALACTRRGLKVGLTQFHADMLVFLFVRILQGVSGVDDMPRLWITAR